MTTVDIDTEVDERHQALVEELAEVTAERDALRLRLAAVHALTAPDLSDDR